MAGRADATIIGKVWKLRRGKKTQQQIADKLDFSLRQVQRGTKLPKPKMVSR